MPQVFDRPLCERLINLCNEAGGRETVPSSARTRRSNAQSEFRKRLDYYIANQPAVFHCRELLATRPLPLVIPTFQFRTTRIERWRLAATMRRSVAIFGHTETIAINARRRFALTIKLNDG